MNQRRLAVVIVLGLGMLGTFLPWVHLPLIGAVYGTKGDGWITFALFAVAIALTVALRRSEPLEGAPRLLVVAPALGGSGVGVWKLIELNSRISDLGDNPLAKLVSQTVGIGPGLYLIVAAGVIAALIALVPAGGAKKPAER